jgi:hypothetical protein
MTSGLTNIGDLIKHKRQLIPQTKRLQQKPRSSDLFTDTICNVMAIWLYKFRHISDRSATTNATTRD